MCTHSEKACSYAHIIHTFCRMCSHLTMVHRVVDDSGCYVPCTAHCKSYIRLPNMTAPYAHKGIAIRKEIRIRKCGNCNGKSTIQEIHEGKIYCQRTGTMKSCSHNLGSGERPSKVAAELGTMALWHLDCLLNDEC